MASPSRRLRPGDEPLHPAARQQPPRNRAPLPTGPGGRRDLCPVPRPGTAPPAWPQHRAASREPAGRPQPSGGLGKGAAPAAGAELGGLAASSLSLQPPPAPRPYLAPVAAGRASGGSAAPCWRRGAARSR